MLSGKKAQVKVPPPKPAPPPIQSPLTPAQPSQANPLLAQRPLEEIRNPLGCFSEQTGALFG